MVLVRQNFECVIKGREGKEQWEILYLIDIAIQQYV